MARTRAAGIDKQLRLMGPGLRIYSVSGSAVRNRLDTDFIGGGHGYVYSYVPKAEVWIERLRDIEDQRMILAHELVEVLLMKHRGMPYADAHDIATMVEGRLRAGVPVEPEVVQQLGFWLKLPPATAAAIGADVARAIRKY